MKKIFLILIFCLSIIVCLCACSKKEDNPTGIVEFKYSDYGIPGNTYIVKINYDNGEVNIDKIGHCSAVDCEDTFETYNDVFNEERLKKISRVLTKFNFENNEYYEEKNTLVIASIYIIKNDEIYCTKGEVDYFEEMNLNNDGKILYSEAGDHLLNYLVNEMGV